MLSKEEIKNIEETFERNLEILSRRMIGTATEITIIEQPMILLFKDLIWRLKKQQKEIDYLETNNKKLIEKLEEVKQENKQLKEQDNNIILQQIFNALYNNETKSKLDEILEIVKGEK